MRVPPLRITVVFGAGLLVFFLTIAITLLILHADQVQKKRELMSNRTSSSHPQIIFYNRIPKTGSTTFTNAVAYDLCAKNGFHVAHLNLTRNRYQMNRIDQARLVRNISEWRQMHPLFVHGHVAHIDFASFGYPPPVWINIVREPFQRFLSHYYFLRYGDNYRVGLRRSKADNNELWTFDDCFLRGAKECDPTSIWLQIPYFCGTAHFCAEPGNLQALELAKRNLLERYLLVGLTERIADTVQLLEQLLPALLEGASEHFDILSESRKHLRHTTLKLQPSAEVEAKFREHPVYRMEAEFYGFAKAEFEATWRRVMPIGNDQQQQQQQNIKFLSGQFHFEKIRP